MRPVRLGVIGCGKIGTVHLQAASASPEIEVVAVADIREEAARRAAEDFEVREVYGDGTELIDHSSAEAVVLAMPTCGRTALALRAFASGKHVLTEKPVAMNAGEVREMIAARGDLVGACCSSRFRFLDSARAAAEFIGTGALGELRVVRCRAIVPANEPPSQPPPAWRLIRALNGGGILANWGCYDLDYLLGITGWQLKPRTVFAQCWTVPPAFESWIAPGSDAETHFVALIRCDGGTVISLERAEYCPAQADAAWEIIGSEGALTLHMLTQESKSIVFHEATADKGTVSRVIWQGNDDGSATKAGPVRDFAQAIGEGREPLTPLERALVVQEITDAIYASAEKGVAIDLP